MSADAKFGEWMQKRWNVENHTSEERSVTECILFVKNPILRALRFRSLFSNALLQTLQNVVDCSPTIFMHKLKNHLHISRCDVHDRSSESHIIFQENFFPLLKYPCHLKSLRTACYFVAVSLSKHAQCVCSRLIKFNAKFQVGFLSQLPIHDKHRRVQHTRDHENTNFKT